MTFQELSKDVIACNRTQDYVISIPTGRGGEDGIVDWIVIML